MRGLVVRLVVALVIGLTTAFALIAGAGWLLAALWLALCGVLSASLAALVTGAAAVVAAALVAAIWYASRARPSAPERVPSADGNEGGIESQLAARLAALAGRGAASYVGAHPGRAALGALAAGFVVGASPQLRATLRDILKF